METTTTRNYDGKWGREIKAEADKQRRIREGGTTPRPWRWLPKEGQFIVAKDDYIVAEIPCQGSNPNDGELIVKAVNSHAALVAALKTVETALFKHANAGTNSDTLKSVDDNQHPWIPGAEAWDVVEIVRAALRLAGE